MNQTKFHQPLNSSKFKQIQEPTLVQTFRKIKFNSPQSFSDLQQTPKLSMPNIATTPSKSRHPCPESYRSNLYLQDSLSTSPLWSLPRTPPGTPAGLASGSSSSPPHRRPPALASDSSPRTPHCSPPALVSGLSNSARRESSPSWTPPGTPPAPASESPTSATGLSESDVELLKHMVLDMTDRFCATVDSLCDKFSHD